MQAALVVWVATMGGERVPHIHGTEDFSNAAIFKGPKSPLLSTDLRHGSLELHLLIAQTDGMGSKLGHKEKEKQKWLRGARKPLSNTL